MCSAHDHVAYQNCARAHGNYTLTMETVLMCFSGSVGLRFAIYVRVLGLVYTAHGPASTSPDTFLQCLLEHRSMRMLRIQLFDIKEQYATLQLCLIRLENVLISSRVNTIRK